MTQIHELTMTGLAAAIHERQLSPVDVANHYLRRTEELNAQVGAYYTVTAELALEQARAAEKAANRRVLDRHRFRHFWVFRSPSRI